MGVPKFYVMISERYPALSSVVKNSQVPEFDNLYLDMNGIIHNCSHPNDADAYFRITENEIFDNIFNYIEVLFDIIKPLKVFFMAVDGVAPRAKMNQQRSRRFRSAKEAQAEVEKAQKSNKQAPKEAMFDSNCITPGTEFMDRLDKALNDFVLVKVNTDALWRIPTIIYSGHATPGEGEHKIMDYIRYARSQPGYNHRTRHCLYGLDADLIMLSLVSHEPLFTLLREEVSFNKKSNNKLLAGADTNYHLLHISLLRDYLAHEFQKLKNTLKVKFDLEKVIDDWILIAFLTGNDFIPHLPHFHIHKNILSTLWETYIKVLPNLDGYLNEGGKLNLLRFELFLKALYQLDINWFEEHIDDVNYLKSKRGEKGKWRRFDARANLTQHNAVSEDVDEDDTEKMALKELITWVGDEKDDEGLDFDLECKMNKSLSSDLAGIQSASEFIMQLSTSAPDVSKTEKKFSDNKRDIKSSFDVTLPSEPSTYIKENFQLYKQGYYREKLKIEPFDDEAQKKVTLDYIKTLQWILHYYYDGIQSWSWFYPYHYSPFVSDLYDLGSLQLTFSKGEPFKPFQQLLAVLPRASKHLLPLAYQCLMEPTSVIGDFYPEDFMTDLNGKMRDWEAVVLIPFIDEERMLKSMQAHHHKLTKEEVARNSFGPHKMIKYDGGVAGAELSLKHPVNGITYLEYNMASVKNIGAFEFCIEPRHILKGLCKQMQKTLHKYESGFPSLSFKKHTAELNNFGVVVFGSRSSINSSIGLLLKDNDVQDVEDKDDLRARLDHKDGMEAGRSMLQSAQCVGWPHMVEVFVTAVCWGSTRAYRDKSGELKVVGTKESFDEKYYEFEKRYLKRYAIKMAGSRVMLECRPSLGTQYIVEGPGNILQRITWSDKKVLYPLHTLVPNLLSKNHSLRASHLSIADLFPLNSLVVCTLSMYYGAVGKVVNLGDKVRVDLTLLGDFKPKIPQVTYLPGYKIASQVGINGYLVSKFTGTIFLQHKGRKLNVGLNLKNNIKKLMVPGYTIKEGCDWLYSAKVIPLLQSYKLSFPELFNCIDNKRDQNNFELSEVFKDSEKEEKFEKLSKFLSEVPNAKVAPQSIHDSILDEDTRQAIITSLNNRSKKMPAHHTLNTMPRFLLSSNPQYSNMLSTCCHELEDRVVNIGGTSLMPFGARGTIVAVYRDEAGMKDNMYQVLFDEIAPGKKDRIFTLKSSGILNLTQRKQSLSSSNNNNPSAAPHQQITIAKRNGGNVTLNVNNHNTAPQATNNINAVNTNAANIVSNKTRLSINELFDYSKRGSKQQPPPLAPKVANLFKHHQKSSMQHQAPNNDQHNVKQHDPHNQHSIPNQHITQQFFQSLQHRSKTQDLIPNSHRLNQKVVYKLLMDQAQLNLQYNNQAQQFIQGNPPIQASIHNLNNQHTIHPHKLNNNQATHPQKANNQLTTHPQKPNSQPTTHPQKPNSQPTTHPQKTNNNQYHNNHQPLKNTQPPQAPFAPPLPPHHWLNGQPNTFNAVVGGPQEPVDTAKKVMKEENILAILQRAQQKAKNVAHNIDGKQPTESKQVTPKSGKMPSKKNEDLRKIFNKMTIKLQQKQQSHQPSKLHHAPSNLEKCEALLRLCQHLSLPLPLYSSITHPNNYIQVKVHLGDKHAYLGSKAPSCQLAYQSAASVALERLHTPALSYIPTQALMGNLKLKIESKKKFEEKNKSSEKNKEISKVSDKNEEKDEKVVTEGKAKPETADEQASNNNNNNANDDTSQSTALDGNNRKNNRNYKNSSKKTRVAAQFNKSSK